MRLFKFDFSSFAFLLLQHIVEVLSKIFDGLEVSLGHAFQDLLIPLKFYQNNVSKVLV